jgi:hypothetical protein
VAERPPSEKRNRVERELISALPRVNSTHRKSTRLFPGRRPFVVDARGAEWRCVDFELGRIVCGGILSVCGYVNCRRSQHHSVPRFNPETPVSR